MNSKATAGEEVLWLHLSRKFMKNQKESSDIVGKFSVHSLKKIQEEITTLSYALGSVLSAVHRLDIFRVLLCVMCALG